MILGLGGHAIAAGDLANFNAAFFADVLVGNFGDEFFESVANFAVFESGLLS